MKGLVLSGGKGTRLRPLTYTAAKQLVPVANKPVLFYGIEDLVEAGVADLGIVVGDTADQIRAAVGDGTRFGARVTYVEQSAPLGLAHAVKIAEPFLGQSRFIMYLGDNFFRSGIVPFVREWASSDFNAMILLHRVPNPQDFGVCELAGGRLVRVVEKPRQPPSDLAIVGVYMFDSNVFEAVKAISPSARGELEITDAIQHLVDRGLNVQARVVEDYWIDTGKMADMLDANRLVLETIEGLIQGSVADSSQLLGRVVVAAGATVTNSIIRGPAIIGERAQIVDSYVGPFTSIDHDCYICRAEIEHSIVMENSRIVDIPQRIEDSLIGRNVEIKRAPIRPRGHKFMLGDFSRVEIE